MSESSTQIHRTPALKALREVIERWRDLSLPWGPIGGVGFELATGRQVTTEASDLDLGIGCQQGRAPACFCSIALPFTPACCGSPGKENVLRESHTATNDLRWKCERTSHAHQGSSCARSDK
jgi:Phosphoribosyl-dephospho-CoA transferase MdcG